MVKVFRMRAKGKRRPLSSLVVEGRLGLSSLSADRDADGENSTTSSLSSRTELSATPTSRCLVGKIVKEECQPSIASTSENVDENVGDPVLAMVVYKPNHPSLLDAFQIWSKFCIPKTHFPFYILLTCVPSFFQNFFSVSSADALLRSSEMASLVDSSRDVVFSASDIVVQAGGLVLNAASIPLMVPMKVTAALLGTADMLLGVAGDVVLGTTVDLIRCVSGDGHHFSSSGGESTSSGTPLESVAHKVTNFFPFLVDIVGKITNDIGSNAFSMVAPVIGFESDENGKKSINVGQSTNTSSGESTAEQESFLDRLRLDIYKPAKLSEEPVEQSPVTSPEFSKYLLRVGDLHIVDARQPACLRERQVLYIDLSKEFSDETLTQTAMNRLVDRGLSIANTNPHVSLQLPAFNDSNFDIEWKPEGSTARLLRKMAQLSELERQERLETQILIWSGDYQGPKHYGSDSPHFLAQGIVPISPRELLNMLWDSDRTGEYNKFCLGRSDVLIVDDGIASSGGLQGTKVIKSQTKVPFTRMSVSMSVCMHARALRGPNEGFMIVSRSLNCGVAGRHVGASKGVERSNKSEILIGVNLLIPIPGKKDATRLVSVSQVSASLVPPFLAKKIGFMGVEDFFNNVRSLGGN